MLANIYTSIRITIHLLYELIILFLGRKVENLTACLEFENIIKMKNIILTSLFLTYVTFLYSQKLVSIYELGDSITNCETNFKNLFNNWTPENVSNANSYKLHEYSFIEAITDSTRFNYYRNYFSGVEPINSLMYSKNHEDNNGQPTREFYIKPNFIHKEYFDQRGLPEKAREIFSEEFKSNALNILTREINIDTIHLNYYSYEMNKIDTIMTWGSNPRVRRVRKRSSSHKGASPDPISKNYIDIFINGTKNADDFAMDEKRSVLIEQLLIERINKQLLFNEQVQIGDKVYRVNFEYNGKLFNNCIICSAESKKVVMDYFFSVINLELKNNH